MNITRQFQPITANLGSESQFEPVGLDIGNGSTKFVMKDRETLIPSYVLPISNIGSTDPELGLIEYLGGDREDLIGSKWFAGKSASQVSPSGFQRVVDDARGKIRYSLQLLAGAIETMPYQSNWKLAIVLSSQDAETFSSELAASLEGTHTIRFRDADVSQVEVQVLSVVEEGIGAIATAKEDIDIKGTVIVYDFGNGTSIASVFQSGRLVDRNLNMRGVENLISAISNHAETRRKLNAPGRKDLIRAGIENRSFDYGNAAVTGFNFAEIYAAELKEWILSGLAPLLKSVADWGANSDAAIAIGGGSMLPKITPLLAAKRIVPLPEAHWANARGLFKLAQLKLHKGG